MRMCAWCTVHHSISNIASVVSNIGLQSYLVSRHQGFPAGPLPSAVQAQVSLQGIPSPPLLSFLSFPVPCWGKYTSQSGQFAFSSLVSWPCQHLSPHFLPLVISWGIFHPPIPTREILMPNMNTILFRYMLSVNGDQARPDQNTLVWSYFVLNTLRKEWLTLIHITH